MSSVIASNIPSDVSPAKVKEFFSFCGKITDLKPLGDNGKVKKYEVVFASPKAVSTALLLSDAELENSFIKVEEVPEITEGETGLAPEQGGAAAAAAATTTTAKDIKEEAVLTGDKTYDEVDQEEKPKYAIFAQLLADGYVISDQVIAKGIEFDKKNGVSSRFNDFIAELDKKYVHSHDPKSTVNQQLQRAQASYEKSGIDQKLRKYFEDAAKSPLGLKIHEYYKSFAKDVADVHQEAVRLANIKKRELEEKKHAESGSTAAETKDTSIPQVQ
ncbi:conserved hypothetical protein [Candida dubliniensis CD36]|uniref:RRM domain-containing protein n=1 Tax=Candida dubliniensis (strain CD36 / ATCC MYA-646 / CBS 7987 / NCPF 3949 / NRRL Y-17841) TaxID=573826 RepID=B9WHZ3_CANDC|nr:conserved hypothetical protein [Candida dubliniensis CD36]CAX41789.1 conserved hypothetical protein [Candida dubliniensis CD36]